MFWWNHWIKRIRNGIDCGRSARSQTERAKMQQFIILRSRGFWLPSTAVCYPIPSFPIVFPRSLVVGRCIIARRHYRAIAANRSMCNINFYGEVTRRKTISEQHQKLFLHLHRFDAAAQVFAPRAARRCGKAGRERANSSTKIKCAVGTKIAPTKNVRWNFF